MDTATSIETGDDPHPALAQSTPDPFKSDGLKKPWQFRGDSGLPIQSKRTRGTRFHPKMLNASRLSRKSLIRKPLSLLLRALGIGSTAVNRLVGGIRRIQASLPTAGLKKTRPARLEERFITGSYANHAGRRAYKLFIPSGYRNKPRPLIVMLHGCKQSPEDFAAGTRMNVLAEENSCLVVYPAQPLSANVSRCWNWFIPRHQRRGDGEPSLIAGITRQVMRDYMVDRRRVYIAGLSAGAAAAAILARAYPDLYAAVGLHSGPAPGNAIKLASARPVMQRSQFAITDNANASVDTALSIIPTIVFHGDQDTKVHPRNSEDVLSRSGAGKELERRRRQGRMPSGHAFSQTLYLDASKCAVMEHWIIHGLGHAWSGGSPVGSYTDPQGPDAAREMLRFFLQHTHVAPVDSR
jgi:poly(hydroxyalkanoate) depolymerase family esterase